MQDWQYSEQSESPVQWSPSPPVPRRQEPDIFELLNKLQGERLNDQRCTMPGSQQAPWTPSRHRLEAVLRGSPPYPMVSMPPEGGFWCDPGAGAGHSDNSDLGPGPGGPRRRWNRGAIRLQAAQLDRTARTRMRTGARTEEVSK